MEERVRESVKCVETKTEIILQAIHTLQKPNNINKKLKILDSSKLFFKHLQNGDFFKIKQQKIFKDLK